jgi:hypothetical protein
MAKATERPTRSATCSLERLSLCGNTCRWQIAGKSLARINTLWDALRVYLVIYWIKLYLSNI